ncbi:hypothetical protein [Lelliottia amnigena]|uniref:hypothetical protein n=1 Tax=Lelliottia amnigena TaxID=61646 RepID=UPI001C244C7B|nr:hypothetical protein [Lelliottia amnigena]QXB24167.1 hypothetical protein I6L76_23165 [Lelliottia amnigena]
MTISFSDAATTSPCRHDSPTSSGECRGDTGGRSAEKDHDGLDGVPAKIEPEHNGKNGVKQKITATGRG